MSHYPRKLSPIGWIQTFGYIKLKIEPKMQPVLKINSLEITRSIEIFLVWNCAIW